MGVTASVSRHIPTHVRKAVLDRDGLICRRCGRQVVPGSGGPDALHLDHVEHWAAGGLHTVDNLIVCCARCNLTRKKPAVVVRARGVVAIEHRGQWWWHPDYHPPEPIQRQTWTQAFFDEGEPSDPFEAILASIRLSPTELIRLIDTGFFRATDDGGPIRVQLTAWIQ